MWTCIAVEILVNGMLLEDKKAIVTGAAQGIGKAIAKMYSQQGAIVVLCDMQYEKAADTDLLIKHKRCANMKIIGTGMWEKE